jgi:zinc/manganese transport system permease protein
MIEFFTLMGPALVACVLLVFVYVYFGIHIVRRGVIFVDLALAQVAAMGTTVAFLVGFPLEGGVAYLFSFGFALFGSAVFTLTRARNEVVPQEAIIGIVYAFATAATVLLVDRAPHGAEHIKYLLVGNILWVSWASIMRLGAVILAVSFFHYYFRDRFFTVSFDQELARKRGISVPLWDFLFYMSLAWVVTSSVHVAGVLLIFSFLIVPAVCGLLLSRNFRPVLLAGWSVGFGVSLVGSAVSYWWDFPTGAAIVCTFGVTLLFVGLVKKSGAIA